MYVCKYCAKEIKYPQHQLWCQKNPNRDEHAKKCSPKGRKMTDDVKKKISSSRKEYLKNNKDKHNWSIYRGHETLPEKKFREFLKSVPNIKVYQYYKSSDWDRFYEMDFAIIENKICFEINGNQHYDSNGDLSEYFQERHDYFVNKGWKIFEIHYSKCFNEDFLNSIRQFLIGQSSEFNIVSEIKNFKLIRNQKKVRISIEEKSKIFYDILKKYDIKSFNDLPNIAKSENTTTERIKRCIKKNNNALYNKLYDEFVLKKKDKKIKRQHRKQKDYFIDKINSYNDEQRKYIILIENSNINFSKFGWVKEVAKIINKPPQKVNSWMKRMMPEFYENKCFKRKNAVVV